MLLKDVIDLLQCEVLWGAGVLDGVSVAACYAADLMSDVLAFSQPGALLVTGLSSIQSAHTADVAEMAAVLYVSDKKPGLTVVEMAAAKGIPLLSTKHTMFDACGLLYGAGLAAAHRNSPARSPEGAGPPERSDG